MNIHSIKISDYAIKSGEFRFPVFQSLQKDLTAKRTNHFSIFNYSYRSAPVMQSLLYVAMDSKYISNKQFDLMYNLSAEINNLIGGFIQHLKQNKKTKN